MSLQAGGITLSTVLAIPTPVSTITALPTQNLNLVTSGGGSVLINGVAPATQGNINTISAQVSANTASIGVGAEPAVVTPSIVSQLGTLTTAVGTALSQSGTISVTASGAGISASPTNGNVIIANTGVTSAVAGTGISVSGATGAVTITNTQLVLSKFAVTTNNVGLGAGFTDQASFTITPTIDTAVLNVWGSVTASEAGSDGLLDVRLNINGVVTNFQSVTIPNNHQQTITVFGTGTGGLPGLPVTISVQARESAGNLTKLTATLMCIAQTTSV